MINYIQKYNQLEPELKAKVSGEKVMSAMKGLEEKYGVKLATLVMRLMVKEVSVLDLSKFLKFEYEMDVREAENLVEDLKDKVLWQAADYLGFSVDDVSSEGDTEQASKGQSIKTSDFFFSSEDEDEVKQLAEKLQSFKTDSKIQKETSEKNLDQMTELVKNKMHINFSAEELNERFKLVIKTYLKGVRNKIDTKQSMCKSIDNGGLDFNDDLASRALKHADEIKKKFDAGETLEEPIKQGAKIVFDKTEDGSEKRKTFSSLSNVGARDLDYDFSKLKVKNEEATKNSPVKPLGFQEVNKLVQNNKAETESKVSEKKEFKIDLDALKQIEARDKESSKFQVKKEEEKKEETQKVGGSSPAPQVSKDFSKPKMEDVKFVPKLTGPIDELREMTLTDFRRLGVNALEISSKVVEKIDNLEKESYESRLKGIRAWRESPVNKLYLDLAEKSIQNKKKVAELISEYMREGKEVLKPEEFSAILELNKKIRY